MQIVECPHCRTRIANDGSLSLMVVTCPGCMSQFQMPALEPPAPVAPRDPLAPASPEDASDLGGEDFFPSRRRKKRRGPSLWIAALGSTVLFWALVFVALWASGYGPFNSSEPPKKAGKKKPFDPKTGAPRPETPSTRQE